MRYIRSSGLITKIMQYAETGKGIIGVCGGYQMLTSIIKDPDNIYLYFLRSIYVSALYLLP